MRTSQRKPFWIHSRPRNAVEPSLALQIASVVHCFPSVPVFQWLLVSYVFLLCILNILLLTYYVSSCCPLGFGHENSPRNRFETPGPVYRKPPGRRRERPFLAKKAKERRRIRLSRSHDLERRPKNRWRVQDPRTPRCCSSENGYQLGCYSHCIQLYTYVYIYICHHMSHVEYVKSKRTSKQWNRAALQLYLNLMNILNIMKLYIKLSSVEKESK